MLEYRHLVINKKDEKVEEEPKIADPISGGGHKVPPLSFLRAIIYISSETT